MIGKAYKMIAKRIGVDLVQNLCIRKYLRTVDDGSCSIKTTNLENLDNLQDEALGRCISF